MKVVRRYLFPLAVLIGLSFFSVLAVEGAHHHENFENQQDCSLCSWHHTGSQAPSTPVSPTLPFYVSVFLFLFTFQLFYFSPICLSIPGRSPPSILL